MSVRTIPIDWPAITSESGLQAGKLCRSSVFGWVVQNTTGIDGPTFGCVTPPHTAPDETLRIHA